jgi:hypothetical protein
MAQNKTASKADSFILVGREGFEGVKPRLF